MSVLNEGTQGKNFYPIITFTLKFYSRIEFFLSDEEVLAMNMVKLLHPNHQNNQPKNHKHFLAKTNPNASPILPTDSDVI